MNYNPIVHKAYVEGFMTELINIIICCIQKLEAVEQSLTLISQPNKYFNTTKI